MSSPTPAPSVFRKRGEAEDEKQNRGVDHARVNARADASVSIDPLRPPRGWWKIGRLVVYNRKLNQLYGVVRRGVRVRA